MKKIKIRYVNQKGRYFTIQRKTLLGWKYITYLVFDFGCSFNIRYFGKSKKEVLKKVLDGYYKTCKKHVTVIEHPGVKIY